MAPSGGKRHKAQKRNRKVKWKNEKENGKKWKMAERLQKCRHQRLGSGAPVGSVDFNRFGQTPSAASYSRKV